MRRLARLVANNGLYKSVDALAHHATYLEDPASDQEGLLELLVMVSSIPRESDRPYHASVVAGSLREAAGTEPSYGGQIAHSIGLEVVSYL